MNNFLHWVVKNLLLIIKENYKVSGKKVDIDRKKWHHNNFNKYNNYMALYNILKNLVKRKVDAFISNFIILCFCFVVVVVCYFCNILLLLFLHCKNNFLHLFLYAMYLLLKYFKKEIKKLHPPKISEVYI